jgi:hypothetical protein
MQRGVVGGGSAVRDQFFNFVGLVKYCIRSQVSTAPANVWRSVVGEHNHFLICGALLAA